MKRIINWMGNQAKDWLASGGRELIVREADKFLAKQLGTSTLHPAPRSQTRAAASAQPIQPDVNLDASVQDPSTSLGRPLGPINSSDTAPRGMKFDLISSRLRRPRTLNIRGVPVNTTISKTSRTPSVRTSTTALTDLMSQSPAFASNFGQRALTRANMQTFLNSAAALAEHYSRIADLENNRRQEALRRYIQSVTEALNNLNAAVNDYATLS